MSDDEVVALERDSLDVHARMASLGMRIVALETAGQVYQRMLTELLEQVEILTVRLRQIERSIPWSDPTKPKRTGRPIGPVIRRSAEGEEHMRHVEKHWPTETGND